MFKLNVSTNKISTDPVPQIEVILHDSNSPARILGNLNELELQDWTGRAIKHFSGQDLVCPDVFQHYNILNWLVLKLVRKII